MTNDASTHSEYSFSDDHDLWDTKDNVHNYIELDDVCKEFIDTPAFQRLRELQQLGLTNRVFAPATHTRFIHSLGVAHLARWYTKDVLQQTCAKHVEIEIEGRDILLVQLAGLTHDLGHGPYSHVFEHVLLPRLQPDGHKWHHEDMSVQLIDHVVDDIDLEDYGLLKTDKEIIKAMVLGDPDILPSSKCEEYRSSKRYLFDIVANKRSGIDVDRLDYLQRDSLMTGVSIQTDVQRLLKRSRVVPGDQGWEICFKNTEYPNLHQFFKDRATMHARVYAHRRVKAIEVMVADALFEVDAHLRISSNIHNVRDFLTLDDTLVSRAKALPDDDSEGVRRAKALLQRVDRRQLYALAGQVVVPHHPNGKAQHEVPTAADLVSLQRYDGLNKLEQADVVVSDCTIDHGMKAANPMDSVAFYEVREGARPRSKTFKRVPVDPQSVSSFLGQLKNYQERSIRVFCRDSDPRKVANLRTALQRWCEKEGVEKCLTTPCRTQTDKRPRGATGTQDDGVPKRLHYQ